MLIRTVKGVRRRPQRERQRASDCARSNRKKSVEELSTNEAVQKMVVTAYAVFMFGWLLFFLWLHQTVRTEQGGSYVGEISACLCMCSLSLSPFLANEFGIETHQQQQQ